MSVLLTSAIYIDSVLTAAGTTVSLGYQREQAIVAAGEGTWVSIPTTPTPPATYYPALAEASLITYPKNALPGVNLTAYPFEMARITKPWVQVPIPTPYVTTEVVEPSVLYFDSGWNGYKYWMGYAPFPSSDATKENPCMAVSNDGINWTAMGAQPLVPAPAGGAGYYNSDPCIAYDSVGNQLVYVFREVLNTTVNLKLMTSTNGITWTTPVIIYTALNAEGVSGGKDLAGESINYNSATSKWEIIGFNLQSNADAWPLVKITSSSLTSGWDTTLTVLTLAVPATGRKFWHGQFRVTSTGAYIGIVQDNNGLVSNSGYLYLVRSDDGTTFYSSLLDNTKSWYQPAFVMLLDSQGHAYLEMWGSQTATTGGFWHSTAELSIGGSRVRITGNNAANGTAMLDLDESIMLGSLLSAGRGGNSGILIADDFNRADSSAGVGNSIDGKTWVQTGGADVIGISTNRAYNVTTGNCRIVYNTGYSDYLVRATLATETTGGEWWITVRYADTSNFIRIGHTVSAGLLSWQVVTGGAAVVNETLGVTPTAGDEIKIICRGEFILIFLRGSLVGVKRDTTKRTNTFVGISLASGLGQYIDNFVAARLM